MGSAARRTVAQIVPALESGGVERGTLEVGAELVARGYRSLVISEGGRLVPELAADGSEHFNLPVGRKSPLTLRSVPRLRSLLIDEGVDILHARSRVPAWVSRLALATLPPAQRPRFVTTCHGLYSVNRYSAVMLSGERVIAISKTVQRYIAENYPRVDPGIVRLVYRGVDPAEFPFGYQPSDRWLQCWHEEYPETRHRPLVTLPGRLARLKGHHTFLEVMHRLRRRVPEAIGLIVGGEDRRRRQYAREIRRTIVARGLDNVILTGHRADINDVLAHSNLVTSLSSHPPEAFGRTTLEALSLGTPVVGFDQAGAGEVLAALYPEGRVAPGDVDGLTDRVVDVLRRPPPVRRNTVFTRQAMLDRTLDVYRELTDLTDTARRAA